MVFSPFAGADSAQHHFRATIQGVMVALRGMPPLS
jgi:hypothetical protein